MNILTWSYVFLLYILCSRGLLFKSYNYLHAFVFSIILYATFDIVNYTREYLIDDKVEVDRKNIEDLVGDLDQHIHNGILNVDVDKELHYSPAEDSTGIAAICRQKVQDIQKYKDEIEKLKSKIVVDESMEKVVKSLQTLIQKLNNQEIQLYKKINSLDNIILSKGTILSDKDNLIYSLNNTISDLSGTQFTLNANLNEKKNEIQNNIETKNLQTVKIGNLELEKNNKDIVIENKTNEITNLTNNLKKINGELEGEITLISKEDSDINQSQESIENKNNAIQKLKNTIATLNADLASEKATNKTYTDKQNEQIGKINQLTKDVNNKKQEFTNVKNTLGKCDK